MSSTVSRIGRSVIVMVLAMLVLGSLQATPAGAQPLNDARDVETKIKDFKLDCETFGGTVTTRPSAMDDDKTIANCKGGGAFDGKYCVFTPTTSDCGYTRDESDTNVNSGQSDVTDLAPIDTPSSDTTVDEAADDLSQHVTGNTSPDDSANDHPVKKGKHKDKKRGKHGKGRR